VVALGLGTGASASPSLEEQLLLCSEKEDKAERFQCYEALAAQVKPAAPDDANEHVEAVADNAAGAIPDAQAAHASSRGPWQQRLTANEPNYISLLTVPLGDTRGDETHAQFFISQKYPLYDPEQPPEGRYWPRRVYFIYNGLYDFYLYENDSYSSSPVLSRLQNPGLALEWNLRPDESTRLRLGWFHESNGQTLEKNTTDGENNELTGTDIFNNRVKARGEDYALASVSRGWDYASARLEQFGKEDFWYHLQLEYRWFCNCQGIVGDREDDIWWEPGNNDEIEDFDGLRFMGETAFSIPDNPLIPHRSKLLTRMELKTGTSDWNALGHITYRPALVLQLNQLNLLAFYFNGYGKEPSTYHLDNEYFGLGFEFR